MRPAVQVLSSPGEALKGLERTWSTDSELPLLAPFGLLEPPQSLPTTPLVAHLLPRADAPRLFSGENSVDEELGPPVAHPHIARWRRLLAFMGPGWLMSVAYVDPGNLEADLQCGARFGYTLLWVLLAATTIGLAMQLVAARLGCATRRHLAEHCRDHYAPAIRVVLWLLTELAIIGSDIQEVIGCSIGLQLLFGLPLSAGVLVTATAAFGFLFLERFGTRPLELFFGMLILVLAMSMGGLLAVIKPNREAVLEGLIFPRLPASAVGQAVGMVGCIIMPHNLFLHSALVQSRVVGPGEEAEAVMLFTVEASAAILTSVLINISVVAIFAKGFFGGPQEDRIGLKSAGLFLGQEYGEPLRVIWALGLCAAGQSSTMTGAYAGQWVMQGYLQLKVKPWKRAIITRSMALVPTLMVAFYFGGNEHEGLDALNGYLNILQSLVLPFAIVPLLTFAGARSLMGDLALAPCAKVACWSGTGLVMLANAYLFLEQLGGTVSAGFVVGLLVYVAAILYVAFAPQLAAGGAS